MKLYIPSIGDSFVLAKDWTFKLHHESRNISLGKQLNLYGFYGDVIKRVCREVHGDQYTDIISEKEEKIDRWKNGKVADVYKNHNLGYISSGMQDKRHYDLVTLPAETILRVDRIYIRKGLEDFDSITFVAESIPGIVCNKVPKAVAAFNKDTKGVARFWVKLSDANKIEFKEYSCLS